jgi:hypothetical protein
MINIANIESSAVQNINVDETTGVVGVTWNSGKEYNYALNGISVQDFVNTVQETIENDKSVGRFINKAIREDQTLQIIAV